MREARQKNLVLILARDLADKLASAVFVVDEEGTLVYFNERCAELLGTTYAEAGAMPIDQWSRTFASTGLDGRPLGPQELPLVRALRERAPFHRTIRVSAADGADRDLAVTALPLFARRDEMVGAMALFWEHTGDDGAVG